MFNINYDDLITKEKIILDHLLKNSKYFSVIAIYCKPYSQMPPKFQNSIFTDKLNPFVNKYIFNRNEWPIQNLSKSKHQVMITYNCSKNLIGIMNEFPNVFLPIENGFPEDMCFYRKEKPWFVTISHEKIAYMLNPAKSDIDFFLQNDIKFYNN